MAKHLHVHALRHAQASASAAEYDELSVIGHAQAKRAGQWFARHNTRFDAIYLGALKRHAQTLAGIHSAYQEANIALPIPCVLPELNEYDFRRVLAAYRLANPADPDLLAGRWLLVLKTAMMAWARDQIAAEGLETWADFQIRVGSAIKRIAAESGEVLVVTSGGVISLIAQRALGFEDETIAALNFAIKNTALNEFRVSRNGWQMQSFNTLPYFSQPEDLELHTRV